MIRTRFDTSKVGHDVIVEGLAFPECPRLRAGEVYLSDMWGGRVLRLVAREVELVLTINDKPGGLGWLPDGDLVVVGMENRRIWRLAREIADRGAADHGDLEEHADLRGYAPFVLNDMCVGPDGTAWVTQVGCDFAAGRLDPCNLIEVSGSGEVRCAARNLYLPNGVVLDGDELVVAEPGRGRLCVFLLQEGRLAGRREIELPPAPEMPAATPDGLCLDDRAGGAGWWIADPLAHRVIRIAGGEVIEQIDVADLFPTAVLVVGEALLITAVPTMNPEIQLRDRGGVVLRLALA